MTWEEFLALPERRRGCEFNQLNPYDDPPIFERVRTEFLKAHPQCGPPNEVIVGEVGKLGPLNGIAVRVLTSPTTTRVPRQFMGLLVFKVVRSKTGGWKDAR
jgi:hypothetical protein